MNKTTRILINIVILLMVLGFVAYMITSVNRDEYTYVQQESAEPFVSKHEKIASLNVQDSVIAFEVLNNQLFVLAKTKVLTFGMNGNIVGSFQIPPHPRDIIVNTNEIYVLYPAFIQKYSHKGDSLFNWQACSELSDYCSFTMVKNFIFVTDVGNKNICKYTSQGEFKQFIESPRGFVTPSHYFDITNWNDTIFCVNPGRHLVESYTLEGEFIAAFGGPGTESGFFAGCCNPAHISINNQGYLFTSEKGNPRICRYTKDGTFEEVILNSRLLGGGHLAYPIKTFNNRLLVASENKIKIYKSKAHEAEGDKYN